MIIEQTFISEDGIYGFNREIVEQYIAIVDDENRFTSISFQDN